MRVGYHNNNDYYSTETHENDVQERKMAKYNNAAWDRGGERITSF